MNQKFVIQREWFEDYKFFFLTNELKFQNVNEGMHVVYQCIEKHTNRNLRGYGKCLLFIIERPFGLSRSVMV